MGGRAYPVRHYPVALRLHYRKGSAILCVVLIPQSGDSSGTTLGVRSVALLHLGVTASKCSPYFSCSQLFAKSVTPFAITVAYTTMSELLLCCKSLLQIDESIFFANNCELTCVCSFFFVTLRREMLSNSVNA